MIDLDQDIDVLIVGGGLIGTSLLLALQSSNIKALLLDAAPDKSELHSPLDARSLALAPASISILSNLNVWPIIQSYATDIHTIHVSEQGKFGHVRLNKDSQDRLGSVVELQILQDALHATINPALCMHQAKLCSFDVTSRISTIQKGDQFYRVKAKIIVAADGSNSSLRSMCAAQVKSKTYPAWAVVANLGLARHHNNCAYERFTPSGPLALLPMTNSRAAMVWSVEPDQASWLEQSSEKVFLSQVQRAFGYRMGCFTQAGQRQIYPLTQIIMPQKVYSGVVFIGNAGQTLHPIAGQGLNLGLRDVAMLAQCLVKFGINDAALDKYEHERISDQNHMITWTDRLLTLFEQTIPGAGLLRGLGLLALDNLPGLQARIIRQASGLAGTASDLVCGIPI